MKYNFKNEKVTVLKYGNGKIVGHVSKLAEKMNGQDYLLDIWYFQKGYGLSYFLVGISIEDDTRQSIEKELFRLMENEYLPRIVWTIDDDILRHEQAPPYGPFKGGWKPPVNPNDEIVYDFREENIMTLNYENGILVAYVNPYRDNIDNEEYLKNNPNKNKDNFMLNLWYFKTRSTTGDFLFGTAIYSNKDEDVKDEILRYVRSGVIDDHIGYSDDEEDDDEYIVNNKNKNPTNFSLN